MLPSTWRRKARTAIGAPAKLGLQPVKALLSALLTVGAGLSAIGLASPAHAAPYSCVKETFIASSHGQYVYSKPWAATQYGPISHGLVVNPVDHLAAAGYFNGYTHTFSATTDLMHYDDAELHPFTNVNNSDAYSGSTTTCIFGRIPTIYGPGGYGVQYTPGGTNGLRARWGSYNFSTLTFYPSSGWMETSN